MSTRTIKKLLLSMIVVGILASFTVGGTFAILSGQANNPNSSIASSTLLLSDKIGATTCYSNKTAANLNVETATCATPFSTGLLYPITSTTPPASPTTAVAYADVTVTSAGLLGAGPATTNSTVTSKLLLYMPNCDATDNATSGAYHGGTNPCCPGDAFGAGVLPASPNPCPTGSLSFFIQEYTSSAFTTTTGGCTFPVSGSACTFTADSLGNFFGLYHDTSDYFSLGTIAPGVSRYFRIGVAEPLNASNNLQGETATMSFVWHLAQQ